MKKFLIAFVAGCIPALVATNGAYAQNSVNTEVLEPQKNATALKNAFSLEKGDIADLSAISPRAIKNFTKTHKNVYGESWEKISDGFAASFIAGGVTSTDFYSRKGAWVGSLKCYQEDKMPPEVRRIVKQEYYDYSITYVQEAETHESEGKPTYIIHLEDKNNIKQVRVFDGVMDTWKEFKKSS